MNRNDARSEAARRNYALAFAVVAVLGALLVVLALVQLDGTANAGATRPANDDLADATALQLTASHEEAQSTEGATREDGESATCADAIGGTVWYRYTAGADSRVVVTNEGTQFETALAVYRTEDGAASFGALDSMACSAGDNVRIEFSLDADETIFIQAGGADGATGELRLQFACDGCAARPATVRPAATSATTGAAGNTPQAGAATSTPPSGTGATLGIVTLPDTGNGGYR